MRNGHQPVEILLVEDNIQDVEIAQRALDRVRAQTNLHVVRDGQEALDYLYRRGKFTVPASSPRPGMILLDLNLPRVSGIEVLRQVKEDPALKSIPVIVLTVSSGEEDIVRSYEMGANTYIQKPVEFEGFVKVISALNEYWMSTATLPQPS